MCLKARKCFHRATPRQVFAAAFHSPRHGRWSFIRVARRVASLVGARRRPRDLPNGKLARVAATGAAATASTGRVLALAAATGHAGAPPARLQSRLRLLPRLSLPPRCDPSWLEEEIASGGSTVSGSRGAHAACPASLPTHRRTVGALRLRCRAYPPTLSWRRCSCCAPEGALAAALLRTCTCRHPAPPRWRGAVCSPWYVAARGGGAAAGAPLQALLLLRSSAHDVLAVIKSHLP